MKRQFFLSNGGQNLTPLPDYESAETPQIGTRYGRGGRLYGVAMVEHINDAEPVINIILQQIAGAPHLEIAGPGALETLSG